MKVFGLVIEWISSPYYQEIWRGVHEGMLAKGANLLTLVTGRIGSQPPWEARFDQLLRQVTDESFDGFVVLSGPLVGRLSPAWMNRFWNAVKRKPVVSVGAPLGTAPVFSVNHKTGFLSILRHLYDHHGYRRFAFAGGPLSNPDAQERAQVFRTFLSESGLTCPGDWFVEGDFSPTGGNLAAEKLVPGSRPEFEVVVCANDDIALGVAEALSHRGLRVPEDVAITGYDNLGLAELAGLTTGTQSLFELGYRAAEALWNLALGLPQAPELQLGSALVARSSCGCPRSRRERVSAQESRLRLVDAEIRNRISRDQLTDLTDMLVNAKSPKDQLEHLAQILPAIGIRRFHLSLEDNGSLDKSQLGPEPWSFFEETLYDRDKALGTLFLDPGDRPAMLSLSAEITDRVSRGVETVHRIHRLELLVAERTAELRELALRDELTHLYNRRGFLALAEHQLKTHRRSGLPLLLFYGDLDGLKSVNDTWGHDAGDEAIRTAARILVDSFRTEDLVARMGGDEFVMLAPGCTAEDAENLAARLETLFEKESQGQYGISLGWITIDPSAKKPLEEWLVLADEALYRTKLSKKASR